MQQLPTDGHWAAWPGRLISWAADTGSTLNKDAATTRPVTGQQCHVRRRRRRRSGKFLGEAQPRLDDPGRAGPGRAFVTRRRSTGN